MNSIVCYLWSGSGTPTAEKLPKPTVKPPPVTAKPLPTDEPPADKPRLANMTAQERAQVMVAERRRLIAIHRQRQRQRLQVRLRIRSQRAPSRPRSVFLPEHVNVLQRMCARHLKIPHRFICIADRSDGLDPAVEFLRTPPAAAALAALPSPEGGRFPSCYRRLWTFSEEAKVLGDCVIVTDIDVVVTRDFSNLFEMEADFVGWLPETCWGTQHRFGGGTFRLTPGTRTDVWTQFKGHSSILEARYAGFRGSDQAWISYTLSKRERYWGRHSGIHSIREMGSQLALPKGARIVHFNGNMKPWDYARNPGFAPWIRENWR